MVSTAPLGKKAVPSLPRNDLHDTCCRHYFPPGHMLIDYPGAQSNKSTQVLIKKNLLRKHKAITNMIVLITVNTWGLAGSLNQ